MEAHRRYQTPHSGEYDLQIIKSYSKAIKLDPTDYLAYFERGKSGYSRGLIGDKVVV
jgi:hypothetical protein